MEQKLGVHLHMSANWDEGYLFLGETIATSRTNFSIKIPHPSVGGAAFETNRMVDAGRNAKGELIGRMVGRSISKQNLSWDKIPRETWWQINRWFEDGHYTFYCHYFNHNTGTWETRLFYLGDVSTNPVKITDGLPKYYENASFSVIDCGVV